MLKLRWPRRKKTGETDGNAQGDASAGDAVASNALAGDALAGVKEAPLPDDALKAPDEVRIRESLEVIKTAVVWLVVINILTVLSPLLWLPLKWALVVGVLLTVSSVVIGCVAYLRARGTQRHLPE
jgi:hypothetical protein